MDTNVYEGMFLLDPTRVGTNWDATLKDVESILTNRQGEILHADKWDERRLAYEIKGQRKGLYVLVYFRMPPDNVAQVERDCVLSPLVLRQMILSVAPKHVENMVAKAQSGSRPDDRPGSFRSAEPARSAGPKPPAEPAAKVAVEPATEAPAEPAAEVAVEPAAEVAVEPAAEVAVEPATEAPAEPAADAEPSAVEEADAPAPEATDAGEGETPKDE